MTTAMTDATTTTPAAPNTISVTGFFADEGFDFLTRMAVGYAAQGIFDVGLVFATIAKITDQDADSWYAAWHRDRREAAREGHRRAGRRAHRHRGPAVPVRGGELLPGQCRRRPPNRPEPLPAGVRPADPVLGSVHRRLRRPGRTRGRALLAG